MPNAGIHLLLVGSVLAQWRSAPSRAPLEPRDPDVVRACMHGSLAPDIGYFPGGDRLFSELAHLVRSTDLARELLASARTTEQRAYALGWLTHLMADAAIHPLLNEAGGEHRYGDRTRPVSSTDDVVTHMRLEVGLDAAMFARHRPLDGLWCGGTVRPETCEWLAGVFHRVHGWSPTASSLHASHRLSGRLSRVALAVNRLHTATLRRRPVHRATRLLVSAAAHPVLRVTRSRSSGPVLAAVMRPLASPRWLIDAVDDLVGEFAHTFVRTYEDRISDLPNLNLITGARADETHDDARTREARRRLDRRRPGKGVS